MEAIMSDAKAISVLGICGSLRKASFNHAALNTAIELKPAGMEVTIADISQIPLYDEDVRAQGFPPPVETLRQQIKAADALLFACPEYNYSMSGVLKNAIDWASRPPDQPFAGKPVAMISAAAGMAGGARAQRRFDGVAGAMGGADRREVASIPRPRRGGLRVRR